MSTFYTNYKICMKKMMISIHHPNVTTWQTFYANSRILYHQDSSQVKHFTLSLIKLRDNGILKPMFCRHSWDFKSWHNLISVSSSLVKLCGKNSKLVRDFMNLLWFISQIIQRWNYFRLWPRIVHHHILWSSIKPTVNFLRVCSTRCVEIWMNCVI